MKIFLGWKNSYSVKTCKKGTVYFEGIITDIRVKLIIIKQKLCQNKHSYHNTTMRSL